MKIQFLVLLASITTFSQTLVLDPTFGNNGIVKSTFTNDIYSFVTSVAIQENGKIITCGYQSSSTMHVRIVMIRYNSDGSIDDSFGTDGIVILSQGEIVPHYNGNMSVKIVNDDQILLVANSRISSTSPDEVLLARYNNDGSLDLDFGNNGIVLIPNTGGVRKIEVQADDKIVITGTFNSRFLKVLRVNPDGSLDETFGINGMVTINFCLTSASNCFSFSTCCKILNDGQILIGGFYNSDINSELLQFAIAKLNANGSLDTNFGQNGMITSNFGDGIQMSNLLVNDQNEIIALGIIHPYDPQGLKIGLAKFDYLGNPIFDFGFEGKVTTQINPLVAYDALQDIVLTNEGKLLGVGFTTTAYATASDSLLVQYTTDGSLDASFGTNGVQTFDLDTETLFEGMRTIDLLPNDKILIGGYIDHQFALVRLVDQNLGVSSTSKANFSIFPNPTKDILNIKNDQEIDAVIISDVLGKRVFEKVENTTQINVSKLQQGIYFMQIQSQGKTFTQKFIKE